MSDELVGGKGVRLDRALRGVAAAVAIHPLRGQFRQLQSRYRAGALSSWSVVQRAIQTFNR